MVVIVAAVLVAVAAILDGSRSVAVNAWLLTIGGLVLWTFWRALARALPTAASSAFDTVRDRPVEPPSSLYDVIVEGTPLADVLQPCPDVANLWCAPATIDLAGAEIELVSVFSRELRLKRVLAPIREDFGYVLIDCPPSLGLITVNALAAASEVLVPIQCEYYALEGLGQLLRNVELVRGNLNPELEVSAMVLTMYDSRTRLAEHVVAEGRTHFGDAVCKNVIPRTVRISESPSFGEPITVHSPSSRGAIAYRELAKEVSGGPA